MIRLRQDCLVFKGQDGTATACSVHEVTVGLIDQTGEWLDEEMVHHASEAVLHYFKTEKGSSTVSMAEFCEALEKVLAGFGLNVQAFEAPASSNQIGPPPAPQTPTPTAISKFHETDLGELARESSELWELLFYPRLRTVVRSSLTGTPVLLRFRGLRPCVKQLAGAKRWSRQCQTIQEQVLDFLRTCLNAEPHREGCLLVVE